MLSTKHTHKPLTGEVLITGLSLFALPEKVVGGEIYPEVDRIHAHVSWLDNGIVRTGTVPVGHAYPPAQSLMAMKDALRRYPIGSVLTPADASGQLLEKGIDRIGDQPRLLQEALICGWFVAINITKGAPFLSRHVVARRRRAEDGAWRTVNMFLESDADRWPLDADKRLLPQIQEAGADLVWRNDINAPIVYSAGRGGVWKALPPANPVPGAVEPPPEMPVVENETSPDA
jgi:hypothetical protein